MCGTYVTLRESVVKHQLPHSARITFRLFLPLAVTWILWNLVGRHGRMGMCWTRCWSKLAALDMPYSRLSNFVVKQTLSSSTFNTTCSIVCFATCFHHFSFSCVRFAVVLLPPFLAPIFVFVLALVLAFFLSRPPPSFFYGMFFFYGKNKTYSICPS